MAAEVLIFNLLSAVAIVSAVAMITMRNPVHSAIALVLTFVNVAAIFIMLRAEFLAAVQIIVYTGAVLVLILFVLMLVNPDDLPEFHSGKPMQNVFGFGVGLILLAEISVAILTRTVVAEPGPWNEEGVAAAGGNIQVIGQLLYSGYVLPIQATALVLLAATIGALFLGRPDEDQEPSPKRRTVATISLAHTRGADDDLIPALRAANIKREAGDRDLIMARDADEFTTSAEEEEKKGQSE
ncbi:MAG: NADH-quinone oxidoreductase subunit J [Sphaerobacteraceae bacterium]|nr:MAG: NADH-quinone oxidoreductase subunit J [Sphaerobacteraceae bacterium]